MLHAAVLAATPTTSGHRAATSFASQRSSGRTKSSHAESSPTVFARPPAARSASSSPPCESTARRPARRRTAASCSAMTEFAAAGCRADRRRQIGQRRQFAAPRESCRCRRGIATTAARGVARHRAGRRRRRRGHARRAETAHAQNTTSHCPLAASSIVRHKSCEAGVERHHLRGVGTAPAEGRVGIAASSSSHEIGRLEHIGGRRIAFFAASSSSCNSSGASHGPYIPREWTQINRGPLSRRFDLFARRREQSRERRLRNVFGARRLRMPAAARSSSKVGGPIEGQRSPARR